MFFWKQYSDSGAATGLDIGSQKVSALQEFGLDDHGTSFGLKKIIWQSLSKAVCRKKKAKNNVLSSY